MTNDFIKGARYLFTGLSWMVRPRLRSFVVVPILVNTVFFSIAIWWAGREFDGLMQGLIGYLPAWLSWLTWLLWPLFGIVILVVIFYTFSLFANLIASPFNGLLAERVEDLARPGRGRPVTGPLWKEIVLTPVAELKKLLYFVAWAVPVLVLFIIPTVNAAASFIWMAFSAWMLALQYADYPMGNHGIRFKEQRRLLANRRLLVFGFGSGVLLVTMIPVFNFLAMPAGVIGATLLWVGEFGDHCPANPDPSPDPGPQGHT